MSEDNYNERMEQHRLIKEMGIKAWAEACANMFPNLDEDKKLMITEGLQACLGGAPITSPIDGFALPEPMSTPPCIFECNLSDGRIFTYDWLALIQKSTHIEQIPAVGEVRLWDGERLVIKMRGEPATEFLKWKSSFDQASKSGTPIYLRP